MEPKPLVIETPSGVVRAFAEPKGDDAVIYTLGGALRGRIHVTGTHHPFEWDQFTALRATFGAVDAMAGLPSADSLPRLSNSTALHTANLVMWDGPYGPEQAGSEIESASGRPVSPKTGETLRAALCAVIQDAARRPDRPRILAASRARDTPALLRFFESSGRASQADIARYERAAQDIRHHARMGRRAAAAWWVAAQWLITQPHPALLLLLADHPGSLARTALTPRGDAAWYEAEADQERRRLKRFTAEAASLRAQMPPRRHLARTPDSGR
ncbi:hypothetical protein [Streptomyces chartreusis]|uniref:hypothetical protein n=1 Tax=Streptomyces chartreusis TaxID=1969 RepID=UPI001672828E|nr:hypothetical protein [Streptomyces chartreusis]GGX55993.1 hypothetical protein GCM10010321_86560 [Streptomyces chartreusis]